MSNNTRTLRNRSSRFSSPATFTAVNQDSLPSAHESPAGHRPSGNGIDGHSQPLVQQGPWVEPLVRNGVPSFEDTKGLERVGVLEHMQPLGAAPNPKILQRLKVTLGNRASLGSARATPGFSEGIASPASQPTESTRQDLPSPVIDPESLDTAPPPPPVPHSLVQQPLQPPFQEEPLPVNPPPGQLEPFLQPPPQSHLQSPLSYTSPYISQTNFSPTSPVPQMPPRPDATSVPYSQQPSSQIIMSPPRGRPAKREVEEMRAYNPDDSMISPAMATTIRPSRASPRYSSAFSDHNRDDRFRHALQNAIDRAAAEGKPEIQAGLQRVLQESSRDELTTALDNISKYKVNVPVNQFKVFKHFVKKGIRKHRKNSSVSSVLSHDDREPSPITSQPAAYVSTFRTKRRTPPAPEKDEPVRTPLILRSGQLGTIIDRSPIKANNQLPEIVQVADLDDPIDQLPKATARKRRSSSTSSLSSLSSANLSDYAPPEMALPVTDPSGEARPARSISQRQAPGRTAAGRPTRSSAVGTDHVTQPDTTQPQLNYTNIDSLNNHKAKRLKLNISDTPVDEEVARKKANLEKTIIRDSAYRTSPSFDRTPSPIRRSQRDEMEEERRKRGLSPRPAIQRRGPPAPIIHPEALNSSANFEPSSPISVQGDGPPLNGISRKRDYDEFARDDQSDQLSSLGPTPPPPVRMLVSTRASIGATSTRSSTPRVAKENKLSRSRRVKVMDTSPQKTRDGATTAGVPGDARAGIDQELPIANGEGLQKTGEDSRHGEECRACGDVGTLLCCDGEGCLNSFHGDCLEPPVNPDDPSIDLWYCPECEKRQKPFESQGDNQLMGALITHVSTGPPRAYTLPLDVRNYFDLVKTGDDGEYVETAPPPTNKKGAPKADHHGALKPPNFKELKDSKGNTRFCYKCNGTTEGVRDIIPCDFCPNEWHLDCLDPPLAVPPRRFDIGGKSTQNWRCPLHFDQDMKNVAHAQHAVPGQMGRRPRLRWPRKHVSSTPKEFFAQNPTNNGLIEPVLEPEEPALNYKTVEMHGTVYKIPELQVKLDFIAKARRQFYMDHAIPQANGIQPWKFHSKAWTPDGAKLRDDRNQVDSMDFAESNVRSAPEVDPIIQAQADAQVRLRQKSFVEQQTVIALMDLADSDSHVDGTNKPVATRSSVDDLVSRLIADAPESVSEQINLEEQKQLELVIGLAQRRLKTVAGRSKDVQSDTRSHIHSLKDRVNGEVAQGQVNGEAAQAQQVNGTTLGHDHGGV